MCCGSQSLPGIYQHVHINEPFIWLDIQNCLFFYWKSISIWSYALKWWCWKYFPNILYGKIFYLFSHCFHEILTIINFHCFTQMYIIFLRSFRCKMFWVYNINGSVIKVETYQIHVIHCCYKNWLIWQLIFDDLCWIWPWSL